MPVKAVNIGEYGYMPFSFGCVRAVYNGGIYMKFAVFLRLDNRALVLISIYRDLVSAYLSEEEYCNVIKYALKALKIFEKSGENEYFMISIYEALAYAYYEKGEYDNALKYLDELLKLQIDLLGENSIDVSEIYDSFETIYEAKGNHDKALEYSEKARLIRERLEKQ